MASWAAALWDVGERHRCRRQATGRRGDSSASRPSRTRHRTPTARPRRLAPRPSASSPAARRQSAAALHPTAMPDYFGTTPNYANSPLPSGPDRQHRGHPTAGSGYGSSRQGHHHRHQLGQRQGRQGQGQGRERPHRVHHRHQAGTSYIDPIVTITGKGSGAEAMAILNSAKAKGGIRKFVDALPGLGAAGANDLGPVHPGRRARTRRPSPAPTTTRSPWSSTPRS